MKRSKRGSEGTNNLDMISQLPEALILEILCLLPIKVAITTSVLSKQWQSHWKMMPKLKIDSLGYRLELANVCRSLLTYKAPVLQSLHLRVRLDGRNNAVDTGILIGIAMSRNVRKLVLDSYFHHELYTFPRSLYNCETLETLTLMIDVILDVPSSVCLKSLRTLHLQSVDFKDDESALNLLSGCPNLQDLVVRRHPSSSVKTFTIAMPSLQRLSIQNTFKFVRHHWDHEINTPSLKYLKIEGFRALGSYLIENIPELVEAYITVPKICNEKVMVSLISVKRLSLALLPLKFPTGIIFYQLVYLELFTRKKAWWDLLPLMLHSSPKLQVLKLIDDLGEMNNVEDSEEWNQPKNVPECLLSHLETFMWKGYKWKRDEEREVAKYILKNTNRLKRATFSSERISYEDRLVVVKDLKSVVRATNTCKFQFI